MGVFSHTKEKLERYGIFQKTAPFHPLMGDAWLWSIKLANFVEFGRTLRVTKFGQSVPSPIRDGPGWTLCIDDLVGFACFKIWVGRVVVQKSYF